MGEVSKNTKSKGIECEIGLAILRNKLVVFSWLLRTLQDEGQAD